MYTNKEFRFYYSYIGNIVKTHLFGGGFDGFFPTNPEKI